MTKKMAKPALTHWLLVIGYWLLVIGYWLLVIGYWLLVIGCWLLVIGYWLLVIGHHEENTSSIRSISIIENISVIAVLKRCEVCPIPNAQCPNSKLILSPTPSSHSSLKRADNIFSNPTAVKISWLSLH